MAGDRRVKLTVVGSAAAYTARPGFASSCYLVEHGSTRIVLDLGQGAFSELWRYAHWSHVAAVFVTHMHADHNVDLIALRNWVRFQNRRYGPALYGPTQLRPLLSQYQADSQFFADLRGETLAARTYAVGDVLVEAAPVTHIPDSWAFRVAPAAGGPGLVYSGDAGRWRDLVPLIQVGDTLLCEAAFGAGPSDGKIHLTAAEAASAAAEGGASRLILTHILDGRNERDARTAGATAFAGTVMLAGPGLDVRIAG